MRAAFYVDLAVAVEEGESELAYLRDREAQSRKAGKAVAEVYRQLADRVQHGESIVEALTGFAPESELAVLGAYLRQGDLPGGLRLQATAIKQLSEATALIRAVVISPLMSFVVVIGMLMVVKFSISPILGQMVEDREDWAAIGRGLAELADFLFDYGWLLLPSAIGAAVWAARRMSRWAGPVRARYENWPVFSLYRDFMSAQILGALAALLKANTPIPAACEQIALRASPWARWHLQQIAAHLVLRPADVGGAFSKGFVSDEVAMRLGDLLRRADAVGALQRLGAESISGLVPRVMRISKLLELLLPIVVGLASLTIVGGIAWTMQEATTQLQQNINVR
jgi:type II secretory pathway component PulF